MISEYERTLQKLEAMNGDETNEQIADAMTDHLLSSGKHLSILHDVGRRSNEGPCPLPYDWHRKNIVGISTKDQERARQWCRKALLLGYSVARSYSNRGPGSGWGTIASARQTLRRRHNSAGTLAKL